MESRFPERIRIERAALDAIASAFPGHELPGLSKAAIERWMREMRSTLGPGEIRLVVAALRIVAEVSRSEADVSDEVFCDIEQVEADEAIDGLLSALAELGRCKHRPGNSDANES